MDEILSTFKVELKRGSTTLLVLHFLKERTYGYSLLQDLEKNKVPIEAGTLYPLLRRLEKQELIASDWDTTESRPRKYYYLSLKGKMIYDELRKEWESMTNGLNAILQGGQKE